MIKRIDKILIDKYRIIIVTFNTSICGNNYNINKKLLMIVFRQNTYERGFQNEGFEIKKK